MHDARAVPEEIEERAERPGDVDVVLDDEHAQRAGGASFFRAHASSVTQIAELESDTT